MLYLSKCWPVLPKKWRKLKNVIFSNFTQISIRGHSFYSNWLKFGPDTPYTIPNGAGAFLKFFIFSDFMLIFHKKNWFLKSTTFLCKEMGIASLLQKVFLKNSQNSPHFEKISNIFAVLTRKCHYIMKTDLSPPISMSIKARGGSGVILACFVHMKVLFIVELQISITFSLCKISSFCKKRQFNNKKYFHMNKTCQNDPGLPPLALSVWKHVAARWN